MTDRLDIDALRRVLRLCDGCAEDHHCEMFDCRTVRRLCDEVERLRKVVA